VLSHHISTQSRLTFGKLTGRSLIEHCGVISFSPSFPLCAELLAEGLKLGAGVFEDALDLLDLLIGNVEVVGHSEHVEQSVEVTAAPHRAGRGATPLTMPGMIAWGAALGTDQTGESNQNC